MWTGLSLLLLCSAAGVFGGLDSGPSPVPFQGSRPSPVPDQDARPSPVPDQGARPSPVPDQDARPSPIPDQGARPSPVPDQDARPSPVPAQAAPGLRGEEVLSPGGEAPALEEEQENQENVISQLLGDYDKVKTFSSGSDCVCRCIVRPIRRSDCSRIHDDVGPASPSYSVETVSKGTDCKKCVCMAPPSAVNPCEGEYRFRKLQEASRDDIKLATIIDLLEGSLYGMDLLKLNSITTKLLSRVDNVEKAIARNVTERAKEKERVKAKEKEKLKKVQQKKKKVNDNNKQPKKNQQQDGLEQPTRNKTDTQNPIRDKAEPKQPIKDKAEPKQPIKDKAEPKQPIKDKAEPKQPIKDKAEPKQPIKDKAEPKQPIKDKAEPKQPIKDKAEPKQPIKDRAEPKQPIKDKAEPNQPIKDKAEPNQPTRNKTEPNQPTRNKTEPNQPIRDKSSMVIRGVTFYKAEEENFRDEEEEEKWRERQITRGDSLPSRPTKKPSAPPTTTGPTTTRPGPTAATAVTPTTEPNTDEPPTTTNKPTTTKTEPTTTTKPTTTKPTTTTTTTTEPTTTTTTEPPTTTKPTTTTTKPTTTTTTEPTTTPQPTTTELPTTPKPTTTTTTTRPVPTTTQQTTESSTNRPPTTTNPQPTTIQPRPGPRSRLTWTESPADQPKTTKKPVVCKDTLASISEPVQQNSYGFSDGAWMRDGRGHGNVIYLTNGHYGNNLVEFRDLETFKSGQPSNSYKLPYSFTGTGHVVFSGSLYYNRAFSRDLIRYDLRHRYVAAWTTLHDALLEEQAHRTHTEVQFAVDESGLWLLYPALDTEGFHQEVILLNRLNPRDLQPVQSFRTGLRRGRYGNNFLVCGVLYAVNSMEHRHANVTYAFDTHTLTHTVPSLAFTNLHAHTAQLAYCPLDKKLYGWDNGHQMTYDLTFAY